MQCTNNKVSGNLVKDGAIMAKATVIDRIELTRRRMALREKLTAEPNDLSPTTELRGLISDLDKIRGFNEWQTRTISQ